MALGAWRFIRDLLSRVRSTLNSFMATDTLLISLLIRTHEPPSEGAQ